MTHPSLIRTRQSAQFWGLIAFLGLVFLIGGSSRADIQSLVILRPISIVVCGLGLWKIRKVEIRQEKFLFAFAAALFGLVILQLIPLPPSIWRGIPGRDLISDIDRVAGLGRVWRPITMVPWATWNAFYSLFVPLAVLILGSQLRREERHLLLPVLLGIGLLSGLIGLWQVVGASDGPLYFYNITNNGSAVGLFSNRNHQAIFLACQFPMLAVFAFAGVKTVEQARFRKWVAIATGGVLVPLLIVTGSRTGLLLGLIGIVSTVALYRKPQIDRPAKRKTPRLSLSYVFGGFAVIGLGLLTILFSRARAFERIVATNQADDLRFQLWGPVARMAWKYFPFGSGAGSFVEVFQIDEPDQLLTDTYINHAHNDWLEVFMTGGFLAVLLLAVAIYGWGYRSFAAWHQPVASRQETAFARLGSVVILMIAAGSIFDYAVRVPSMMCFLTITALWLRGAGNAALAPRGPSGNNDGSRADSPLAG